MPAAHRGYFARYNILESEPARDDSMKLTIHNIYQGALPKTYIVELTGDGVSRQYTVKVHPEGGRMRPEEGEFFRFFMGNPALFAKIAGAVNSFDKGIPPTFPLHFEDTSVSRKAPPRRPR